MSEVTDQLENGVVQSDTMGFLREFGPGVVESDDQHVENIRVVRQFEKALATRHHGVEQSFESSFLKEEARVLLEASESRDGINDEKVEVVGGGAERCIADLIGLSPLEERLDIIEELEELRVKLKIYLLLIGERKQPLEVEFFGFLRLHL